MKGVEYVVIETLQKKHSLYPSTTPAIWQCHPPDIQVETAATGTPCAQHLKTRFSRKS